MTFKGKTLLGVSVLLISLLLNTNPVTAEDIAPVYFVKGLYYEYYQVEEGAKLLNLPVQSSYFNYAQGRSSLRPAFPENADTLSGGVRLIVLANVNSECLGYRGRKAIETLVKEEGVGLLLFGEYFMFGGGGYPKSIIGKMMPVELTDKYNLVKASAPMVLTPSSDNLFTKLSWADKPSVLWYHRLTPKRDAEVLVKMGNEPFLVVHPYGKGKVGVITGTVLGIKDGAMIPFWEWKDFPKFMAETMELLIRRF